MSKDFSPFLAHSELSDLIYIITKDDKYEVTEQCIKAMEGIGRLPKWIPCTEREPERESESQMRGYYLTTNAYGTVSVTRYEFEGGGLGFGWGSDIRIIAWQPLPKGYKETNKNKV